MSDQLRIVILGAGNVATHLALALFRAGFDIRQIYSRTYLNAQNLAKLLRADCCDKLDAIQHADVYLYALTDDALPAIVEKMPIKTGVHVHTAGSISINLLQNQFENCGVMYPLQTFSVTKAVELKSVPLFVESTTQQAENVLSLLANRISEKVYHVNSQQRLELHISAVFACNFSNYLYQIAHGLLLKNGLPFELLLPLIDETAQKLHSMSPYDAQTGPARRHDKLVVGKHIEQINDVKLKQLYALISNEISTIYK